MQARVAMYLGVERHREDVSFADGHGMAVDLGQHLDARPVLRDPRRPDEYSP